MNIERAKIENLLPRQNNSQYGMVYTLGVCFCLIFVPLIWFGNQHSPVEAFLAILLFSICLYPMVRYWANKEGGLPTFPLLCLAYALQFAVPIFTREPTMPLAGGQTITLNEEDIIAALILSILGVCAIGFGYYWAPYSGLLRVFPQVRLPINRNKAEVFGLLFGLGLPLMVKTTDYLPEQFTFQFSAIIRLLQNQALVAIALLGGIYYLDKQRQRIRLLLYLVVLIAVVQGMSTGMLEQAIVPLLALLLIRWHSLRRLPLLGLGITITIIVFLSPVKQAYREEVWYGASSVQSLDSPIDKVSIWFRQASDYWLDTLSGEKSIDESTEQASSRLDLIHQLAHIYSRTPSRVPYQYGTTYSFFLVALIPRALWPDKPEAGSANYFYGVNYEITTEEGAKRSTFGVGLVGESFINFGWVGVILIMALQGIVLSVIQFIFGGYESKLGGQAILIAFFVYFLNGIGSSAEILFGNIFQNLFFSTVLIWWIREKQISQSSHNTAVLTSVGSK